MDKVISCENNTNVKEILYDIKGDTSNHRDSSLNENIVSISNFPCELIQKIALHLNHIDYCSLRCVNSSFKNKLNPIKRIVQNYKYSTQGELHEIYHDFLNQCPIWKVIDNTPYLYKYSLSSISIENKENCRDTTQISIYDCFYEGGRCESNVFYVNMAIFFLKEIIKNQPGDNFCTHLVSSRFSKWDSHQNGAGKFFCISNSLEFNSLGSICELQFLLGKMSYAICNEDFPVECKILISVIMGKLKDFYFQYPIGDHTLQEINNVFNLHAENIAIGAKALSYLD